MPSLIANDTGQGDQKNSNVFYFFQGRGGAGEIEGLSADQLGDTAPQPLSHDNMQVEALPHGIFYSSKVQPDKCFLVQSAIIFMVFTRQACIFQFLSVKVSG